MAELLFLLAVGAAAATMPSSSLWSLSSLPPPSSSLQSLYKSTNIQRLCWKKTLLSSSLSNSAFVHNTIISSHCKLGIQSLFHIQRQQSHHLTKQKQQHSIFMKLSSTFENNEVNKQNEDKFLFPAASLSNDPTLGREEIQTIVNALYTAGYQTVIVVDVDDNSSYPNASSSDVLNLCHLYVYSRATGMLKLDREPLLSSAAADVNNDVDFDAPCWVPIVRGEENVLVANGWSFLDPDESEPNSAFDIDAANEEGQYKPKWGVVDDSNNNNNADDDGSRQRTMHSLNLSSLGYDLTPMTHDEIMAESKTLLDENDYSPNNFKVPTRSVLLHGNTDSPNVKLTHNRHDFTGPTGYTDVIPGIFICAIGGLPLFTTDDLSITTASSGWLSFSKPICMDHVVQVEPLSTAVDRRIEVVCAKSKCHLGHYFGKGEGYCINASALDFIAAPQAGSSSIANEHNYETGKIANVADDNIGGGFVDLEQQTRLYYPSLLRRARPVSWRFLDLPVDKAETKLAPSIDLLKKTLLQSFKSEDKKTHSDVNDIETICLGAGCFWHVEYALRKIPGIIQTQVGYAGGTTASSTYRDVCSGKTGHAEVVQVTFDTDVCPPHMLFDCFLAMHDPTKVRSHGKHAMYTGQYRSCIFVPKASLEQFTLQSLEECQDQLGKELSTEVRNIQKMNVQFWKAEERHQRHDERLKTGRNEIDEIRTLPIMDWLQTYGQRSKSVWGAMETVQVAPDNYDPYDDDDNHDLDDGMARLMI